MSLVLRHQPDVLGIKLDRQGWTDVSILINKMKTRIPTISFEQLKAVVAENDKQRFTFNEDYSKIRANQGHSVNVDLGLEATSPPSTLYHGTASRFLDSILEQGLLKGTRQHVHLSDNLETASKVGLRHGKLRLLEINCEAMLKDGYLFYQSKNGVWLTDHVPPSYLKKS